MRSSEVSSAIDTFLSTLLAAQPLLKQLASLSELWKKVLGSSERVLTSSNYNVGWERIEQERAMLNDAVKVIRSLKASEYAREIRILKSAISALASSNVASKNRLEYYRNIVEYFSQKYDSLVDSSYGLSETYSFLQVADVLHQILSNDRSTLAFLHNALQPKRVVEDQDEEITFLFGTVETLEEIAQKLDQLSKLYAALAQLMGVQDSKLRVVKVETGTLEIVVTGAAAVILVLRPLIVAGCKAAWERFLPEGRVEAAIAIKMKAIQADTQLIEHFKSRGYDVSGLERLHGENGQVFARQLSEFMDGYAIPTQYGDGNSPNPLIDVVVQKALPPKS